MNANQQIIYKQRPCVVLDAKQEGYSLEANQLLLQEESSQYFSAGPMRHLVHDHEINQIGNANGADGDRRWA